MTAIGIAGIGKATDTGVTGIEETITIVKMINTGEVTEIGQIAEAYPDFRR